MFTRVGHSFLYSPLGLYFVLMFSCVCLCVLFYVLIITGENVTHKNERNTTSLPPRQTQLLRRVSLLSTNPIHCDSFTLRFQ